MGLFITSSAEMFIIWAERPIRFKPGRAPIARFHRPPFAHRLRRCFGAANHRTPCSRSLMLPIPLRRWPAESVLRRVLQLVRLPRAGAGFVSTVAGSSRYKTFMNCVGTRHAQLQVVNALHRGDRERASKLLSNLVDLNNLLRSEDFSYILQYCAQAPDPSFVVETWKIMESKNITLDKATCRFILQAFSKGGYVKEAFDFLKLLGENDHAQATLTMFNIVLSGCGRSRSLTYMVDCVELMEAWLVGKSEVTYWELLRLAVLQKNISTVHDIWKDYIRHYSPSIIGLRKFIWSFTKLGDLESAHTALKHMLLLAKQGSSLVSVSSIGRYHSSRLDIPMPTIDILHEKRFWLQNLSSFNSLPEGDTVKTEMEVDMDILSKKDSPLCNFFRNHKSVDSVDNQSIRFTSVFPETTEHEFFRELGGGKYAGDCTSFPGARQIENTKSQVKMKQESEMTYNPLMKVLRWSFNDMIHACAILNNYQLAEDLFLEMLNMGLVPSRHTYDGFVKAAVSGKGVASGAKLVGIMQKRNIKPYNDTFAALSVGYSKTLELDLAEHFSGKISDDLPKYIHTFNIILSACNIMDEPERAIRILAKLKRLGIKLNIRTYELMFSLFGTVNVPYEEGNLLSHADVAKRIRAIEKDMMTNGIAHSHESMKNLIRSLGAEGMISEMLQYLNVAENIPWQIDSYQKTDMYNVVLHALVKAKESVKAMEVFKSMRLCGLLANAATYNIMIESCRMLPCFQSACALISLLVRDGYYPDKLTYTSLVKVLLATEDFDGALNLLNQLVTERIQPDIQLFNSILREACFKGRIDIIELIVECIHRGKIKPNPSTLWYTFSAYVDSGFHATALEALQVLSMRIIYEEEEKFQEKIAVFDELIYGEDPDVELQIIRTFKDSQEYIATALMNLRWCAIMGSSISWCPEESSWAKRLSLLYTTNKRLRIVSNLG